MCLVSDQPKQLQVSGLLFMQLLLCTVLCVLVFQNTDDGPSTEGAVSTGGVEGGSCYSSDLRDPLIDNP